MLKLTQQGKVLTYILFLGVLFLTFCKNNTKTEAETNLPATTAKQGPDPMIQVLNEKIAQQPNSDTLYYQRAEAYYKAEGYDEAIKDLRKAILLDSTKFAYYHLLADAHLDYFQSYPAIEVLERAAQKFPNNYTTQLKLSEFYLIVKKHNEALKAVDRVIKLDPQNAEAFFMAGMVMKDKGDTLKAIKSFERSMSLDPENADGWIILGNLVGRSGSIAALKYYENALRVDTTSIAALDGIATYYHKKGDYENAIQSYRRIIEKAPTRPETFFDIGLIYLERDSLDKAMEHFEMSIKADPLYFKAIYYKGVVKEQQGQLAEAKELYHQVLKMFPGFEDAKIAEERVNNLLKK